MFRSQFGSRSRSSHRWCCKNMRDLADPGPQNEQTQHEMLLSEVSLWREIWVGINWTNCHEKMNMINYCIANRKEQQCQPWFGNMQYLNMRDPILTHDHTKANGLDLQWLIDVDRDYKRHIFGEFVHGTSWNVFSLSTRIVVSADWIPPGQKMIHILSEGKSCRVPVLVWFPVDLALNPTVFHVFFLWTQSIEIQTGLPWTDHNHDKTHETS